LGSEREEAEGGRDFEGGGGFTVGGFPCMKFSGVLTTRS
jgi:hypothetical protein